MLTQFGQGLWYVDIVKRRKIFPKIINPAMTKNIFGENSSKIMTLHHVGRSFGRLLHCFRFIYGTPMNAVRCGFGDNLRVHRLLRSTRY